MVTTVSDRHVTRVAQLKDDVRKADWVAVAQVETTMAVGANRLVTWNVVVEGTVDNVGCVLVLQEDQSIIVSTWLK